MGLFKSKYEKELDAIIGRIDMNLSNNYKDAAHSNLKELETTLAEYVKEEKLKDKVRDAYENRLHSYQERMKGYTHKDQKPYWH